MIVLRVCLMSRLRRRLSCRPVVQCFCRLSTRLFLFAPLFVRRCHPLNLLSCFFFLLHCLPSAMAEQLGIEFMGMEQSILILSHRVAAQ